jgi:hypothetical protein
MICRNVQSHEEPKINNRHVIRDGQTGYWELEQTKDKNEKRKKPTQFKVGKKILNAEDLGWSGSSGKRPVQKKKKTHRRHKKIWVYDEPIIKDKIQPDNLRSWHW